PGDWSRRVLFRSREHRLAHEAPRFGGWHRLDRGLACDRVSKLRVANSRGTIPRQAECDVEHHVAAPVLVFKAAVAIAERALPGSECLALERRAIEAGDAHERLGNFLPVRSYVLYRRATDGAGDTRQAFDPRPASR